MDTPTLLFGKLKKKIENPCFLFPLILIFILIMDRNIKNNKNSTIDTSSILSDSGKCRRGYYFRAWVLYFSFGTSQDVNIKQLCSSCMYERNL